MSFYGMAEQDIQMQNEEDPRKFRVFHRTWWRENPDWPNGLEPYPGKKRKICEVYGIGSARARCAEWNATHKPGRLSDKAEFEEV